jgi:hypothetical protein
MAKRKDPLVWGLVLIVIGLIFILENFHVNAWEFAWRFWPAILILWGAGKLIDGLKAKSGDSAAPRPPAEPRV